MRIINARSRVIRLAHVVVLAVFGAVIQGQCAQAPAAATDPLLDLFIKKGFVTQQEAQEVEAEAAFNRTNRLANAALMSSKWKITQGIQHLQLFGDVRLRYEDRSAADLAGNSIDLQRFRYSVRVGLRGEAFNHFYYGLRLDTGVNPRSPWLTLGTSASGGPYQGPFGKSTAGVSIGQAYLGWRPWEGVDLTVGKMPNPLYTTTLVWDSDLNPEGAAEHFQYPVGRADFFGTFGQFLYADFNPNSASAGLGIGGGTGAGIGQKTDNIFLFAWQGGVRYRFTTNVSAKVAATLYHYLGVQRSGIYDQSALSPFFGDPYIGEGAYALYGGSQYGYAPGYAGYGQPPPASAYGYQSAHYPFNQVGLDHLLVVELPFQLDFNFHTLAARVFGDVAYNLEGAQRAEAAAAGYQAVAAQRAASGQPVLSHSFSAQTSDDKAYQIGLAIGSRGALDLVNGSTSRRHAWEFKTYWQHVEQYALDPNLLDSDFFEGRANMEGIYVALAYSFTDNLIGTVRYGHASRINPLLGTGGDNQDIPQINPINSFNLYQVDLTFRF